MGDGAGDGNVWVKDNKRDDHKNLKPTKENITFDEAI